MMISPMMTIGQKQALGTQMPLRFDLWDIPVSSSARYSSQSVYCVIL